MDAVTGKLINRLQKGLPLEKDPYRIIGEELGISKSEVVERIQALKAQGMIRRIGGTFDTRKMGYVSILIGGSVPEEKIREVAGHINGYSGVTHNYRRSGFLNMWFTLSVKDAEEKERFLRVLKERHSEAEFYEFPKLKSYKLAVFFDMEGL